MKRLLVLMVVLLSFMALSALEDGGTVFLGAGMSWLTGIPGDTQNGMMGFGFGTTYQKNIFDGKGIYEPGIRWMQRGMSADATIDGIDDEGDPITTSETTDIETSYLDLFIKIKSVCGKGNFSVQPYIGPNVGFLMIAKNVSDDNDIQDVRDEMKTPTLSLLLGVDFLLWNMINIGLEYNYGLTYVLPGKKVTGNTALVNLGYKF